MRRRRHLVHLKIMGECKKDDYSHIIYFLIAIVIWSIVATTATAAVVVVAVVGNDKVD